MLTHTKHANHLPTYIKTLNDLEMTTKDSQIYI